MEWFLSDCRLTINNLNDAQISFLNWLLPEKNKNIKADFQYFFNQNFKIPNDGEIKYKLKGKTIICENKDCYVEYYNGMQGHWKLSEKKYFYNHNYCGNIRHWFINYIIDPFSLSCMEINKLILHGALWSNGKEQFLIMGNSGSGKSTISYLLRNDFRILSDDIILLNFTKEGINAEPINLGYGLNVDIINNVNLIEKNILVSTNEKVYLKSLYNDYQESKNSKIYVSKILILKNHQNCSTQIIKLNLDEAIKTLLDMQTNIKTPLLFKKYLLMKEINKRCDTEIVKYDKTCDINKIRDFLRLN